MLDTIVGEAGEGSLFGFVPALSVGGRGIDEATLAKALTDAVQLESRYPVFVEHFVQIRVAESEDLVDLLELPTLCDATLTLDVEDNVVVIR